MTNDSQQYLNRGIEAYTRAQRHLEEINKGYVFYDLIFSTLEEANAAFELTSSDILDLLGHRFYWKRALNEPMFIYAKNDIDEALEKKGLVEICRLQSPSAWVGTGPIRIHFPRKKDDDTERVLLSLYLFSTNPEDLERASAGGLTSAYLSSFYFENINAQMLRYNADQRFDADALT